MLSVTADITFTAALPPSATTSPGRGTRRSSGAQERIRGRVRSRGQTITVQLSELPSLAPLAAFAASGRARAAAEQLADQGLIVRIVGPGDRLVVELGHQVHAPRWQTLLTRTRAIRIASLGACLRSLRGPRLLAVVLPRGRWDRR